MSDYNFLMESRLSSEQMQVVNYLSRIASGQGLNLYLVGGAVRDLVYGLPAIRDLDFVVEGNPQRVLRALEADAHRAGRAENGTAIPLAARIIPNRRVNASELYFANGVRAELAESRRETYLKPGRPPEVETATIFDDLRRRDFSANAMAISLHPNSRGLLLDPTNGAADIAQREFRTLHSRSFLDDPSRIYRLLRLGERIEFKPAERTRMQLQSAIENRLWEQLSPEQQGLELRAILREENPGRMLKIFAERGLLKGLDRKVASTHIAFDRFAKVRSSARSVPGADPFLVNFYSLAEKAGGSHWGRLAAKIMPDAKSAREALELEQAAKKLARALSSAKASRPSQVYAMLSGVPQHLLLFLVVEYPQVKIHSRLKSYLVKIPQVRARLPRAELQAMGVPPGPKFEKIMERIFLDQLDGKIKGQSQLLKEMRSLGGIKEPPPQPKVPAKVQAKVQAKAAAQVQTKAEAKVPAKAPAKSPEATAQTKSKPVAHPRSPGKSPEKKTPAGKKR